MLSKWHLNVCWQCCQHARTQDQANHLDSRGPMRHFGFRVYVAVWPLVVVTGHDLPHRMANAKVPPPVRHFAAPEAEDVPIPNSTLSKSPLQAAPKPSPSRRRRSTGSHLDRAAEARNISRSRSSSVRAVPRAWTPEDLRELKTDSKARPNWKTVAGKLARSVDDCKARWKRIQDEDARK